MQDENFWACVRRIGSILGGLADELSRIEEAAASGQNAEDLDLNL